MPIESAKPTTPFRRLMIAQDTGSAIVGPARADLYWGAGDDAGRIAGRIRHPGRFVMLLPRELDMVAAGKHMPLPVPKPKISEDDVKDDEPRTEDETKKDDGKSEAGRRPRREESRRRPRKKSRQQAGPARSRPAIMSADDGSRARRKLTDEERVLWGRITRSVAPLRRRPVPAEPLGRRQQRRQAETEVVRKPRMAERAPRSRRRSRRPGSSRSIAG